MQLSIMSIFEPSPRPKCKYEGETLTAQYIYASYTRRVYTLAFKGDTIYNGEISLPRIMVPCSCLVSIADRKSEA